MFFYRFSIIVYNTCFLLWTVISLLCFVFILKYFTSWGTALLFWAILFMNFVKIIFCHRPKTHVFQFHSDISFFQGHFFCHFSNLPHIFYHQSNNKFQNLLFCPNNKNQHIFYHQSICKHPIHASCYFSINLHNFLHQLADKNLDPLSYPQTNLPHILTHRPFEILPFHA